MEAISKADLKSFSGNGRRKHVWATTTVQCSLGMIQDGRREKINNVSVLYMLTRETTK